MRRPYLSWLIAACVLGMGATAHAQPVAPPAIATSPSAKADADAAMVAAAADRAEERVGKQNNFYWSVASTVGTFLLIAVSFVGFGAWRNIRQGLRDELRNELRTELLGSAALKDEIRLAVTKDVASEFERSAGRLERQIQLNRLQYLADKVRSTIRNSGVVTDSERDALFQQLILLKDDKAILGDPVFMTALEQVLDSFYASSLWSKLDELEGHFAPIIKTQPRIVFTVADTYALRLLGELDTEATMVARFNTYLDLLEECGYVHRALGFGLAYEAGFATAGYQGRMTRLVERSADLSPNGREMLRNFFDHWGKPENLSGNPKSTHIRVSAKFEQARPALEQANVLPPAAPIVPPAQMDGGGQPPAASHPA